jgi:Holliday junction resolvase RusA-like endonuclease
MSTTEAIEIILPPLAKALQPNCTVATMGMRMAKGRIVAAQRKRTVLAVQNEECESLPWAKCSVHAKFYFKDKRGRDIDNLIGALKSTYDGLVDAGIVPDDTPEYMVRDMPEVFIDRQHPRVEITITRLA